MPRSWLTENHVMLTGLVVLSVIMVVGGLAPAAGPAAGGPEQAKEDTYPLEACIVSGENLGSMGEPFIYEHEGREIRLCCAGCLGRFLDDPDGYMKKMDEAIIARELPEYPLETCIVSGDTLGAKGAPMDRVYDNRLVRFCRADCIRVFEQAPGKYMTALDEARAAQTTQRAPRPYPLDTCLVSGGKLGSMGQPVVYTYKGQEIRFCCAGCIPRFEQDPEKYMKKLGSVETGETGK